MTTHDRRFRRPNRHGDKRPECSADATSQSVLPARRVLLRTMRARRQLAGRSSCFGDRAA